MQPDSPEVTILIVNWNAGDYLIRCLKTIPQIYPVIIVDNNSKDGSIEKVASMFPGVKIIKSPINLGFAAGNNLGLKEVATKYVLFLNPDTEVIDDAIEQMVRFLETHPDYDAVGPRIIEANGEYSKVSGRRHITLWTSFCNACLLDRLWRNKWLGWRYIPEWDRQTSRDVECLAGCAMLMRTGVVKEVGGFDESVPLYLDDNDLSRKITERGGRIYCLVEANIRHIHFVSSNQAPSAWITQVELLAYYVYLQKYERKYIPGMFRFFVFLGAMIRLGVFSILSCFNRKYFRNLKVAWDMLTFSLFYCGSEKLKICPE